MHITCSSRVDLELQSSIDRASDFTSLSQPCRARELIGVSVRECPTLACVSFLDCRRFLVWLFKERSVLFGLGTGGCAPKTPPPSLRSLGDVTTKTRRQDAISEIDGCRAPVRMWSARCDSDGGVRVLVGVGHLVRADRLVREAPRPREIPPRRVDRGLAGFTARLHPEIRNAAVRGSVGPRAR